MVHYIYWGVTVYYFQKNIFLSLKIHLVLANSVDPDEMPHNVAFHPGLHCLPKYLFRGFWTTKGSVLLTLFTCKQFLLQILRNQKHCLPEYTQPFYQEHDLCNRTLLPEQILRLPPLYQMYQHLVWNKAQFSKFERKVKTRIQLDRAVINLPLFF